MLRLCYILINVINNEIEPDPANIGIARGVNETSERV